MKILQCSTSSQRHPSQGYIVIIVCRCCFFKHLITSHCRNLMNHISFLFRETNSASLNLQFEMKQSCAFSRVAFPTINTRLRSVEEMYLKASLRNCLDPTHLFISICLVVFSNYPRLITGPSEPHKTVAVVMARSRGH